MILFYLEVYIWGSGGWYDGYIVFLFFVVSIEFIFCCSILGMVFILMYSLKLKMVF